MTLLGIDIGTSAVKAALIGAREEVVAEGVARLGIKMPLPGRYEQDPDSWWHATEAAVAEVRAAHPDAFASIAAIGLSGQMHGAVILDADDQPIRPAILWNDARAGVECADLESVVPGLPRIAGIGAMPGFTAPKLHWLRRHEPRSFDRIACVVSAKDFVRLRLTGDFATDMVDAAGMLLLDEAARDWSDAIVTAVGLSRAQLPRLLEGPEVSGSVRTTVAAAWGLSHAVPVVAGAGDVAAGAIGLGAIGDRDEFLSLGTSAQIFRSRDLYQPKPESLIHTFAHALPDRWFEMAALLNGASCLDWAAKLLGIADIAEFLNGVERSFRSPAPVLFLPYLSGERTPLNDPGARGVFAHLDYGTTPETLIQAVLEGVVFALMDGQLAFGDGLGGGPLAVAGGGTRSRFWLRLIASGLRRPLLRVAAGEKGPAFGAARLARIGLTGETPAEVCGKPKVLEVIEPHGNLADAYGQRFETFRGLYRAVKGTREDGRDRA